MEGPGGNLGAGGSDPGGGAKGLREDADCAALLLGEDEEFDCTWFDWPCPMKG
jgi:hypothetical protein